MAYNDTSVLGVDANVEIGGTDDTNYLLRMGTSASPIDKDGTSLKGIQAYFRNSAASGDIRGAYIKLTLDGGAGGEAARLYTFLDASAGTAHGAHISLDYDTDVVLSGLGVAVRATHHVPNSALTGTLAGVQSEFYSAGTSSDISGTASFFRCVLGGNATGSQAVDDVVNLFHIDGPAIGSGNMVAAKSSAAVSHVARCNINGVAYYIMLSNAI